MSEIEIVRNPAMIAGEINLIKKQTRERILSASVEIGRRLQEVKGMIGHGEWSRWLSENVQYSQSTADNLMRIAVEFGDDQIDMISGRSKSETFANLSYSQAVALFSLPEAQREEFVEAHDMESMSARDVQQEIKAIMERAEAAERERDEALSLAKKSEAEAADAIAKGAKAVTELDAEKKKAEDAEAKRKDASKKLKEAEAAAAEAKKRAEKASADLQEARAELAQAQAEAAEQQPAMEAAVSEEALEAEREKIRAEYAQKIAAVSDEHLHAFKFAFEEWQQDFRKMVGELKMISKPETADKLRGKIGEKLGEMEEEIGT